MLSVPCAEWARIVAHLEAGYPHEACGILIGEIDGAQLRVHEAILTRNTWAADAAAPDDPQADAHSLRDRYLIDPHDIVRADRDAAKRNLDIIGFFHSHPDWPCQPSETDRAWAWPVVAFLIVSVPAGRVGDAAAWVLRDDRSAFDGLALEIA